MSRGRLPDSIVAILLEIYRTLGTSSPPCLEAGGHSGAARTARCPPNPDPRAKGAAVRPGSLHKAAKALIASLNLEPNTNAAWDACPVVRLYTQAVELHLKALVDEGANFLPTPTDPLSLAKTHSAAVAGANRLPDRQAGRVGADLSVLVSELEALDPVAVAVQSRIVPVRTSTSSLCANARSRAIRGGRPYGSGTGSIKGVSGAGTRRIGTVNSILMLASLLASLLLRSREAAPVVPS